MAERLRGHAQAVADARAEHDDVVAAADRDLTLDERDHADDLLERGLQRRAVGVADRDRERVGRMVGLRQLRQRQERLDHPLHLLLPGPAGAA